MYCRFILIACCLFMGLQAFTQTANIKKGDVCMQQGEYAKAAAFYKKAADYNFSDVEAKEKLAKALMALGDYASAEAIYQVLAGSPKAGAIDKFYYAQVLRINGKYEVADIQYRAYAEAHPNDPLNDEFRNFLANVQILNYPNPHYRVIDIPENSSDNDEGPTFCVYNFCFTSDRPSLGRKGTYDLYFLRGGNTTNPARPEKIKGKINRQLDEGPATFSSNGQTMIFTRSNYKNKSDEGFIKLGLYQADYDSVAKKWVNIVPLPFVNYNYNYMQPSLSKDGNRLFFASDLKGGLGETDIYESDRQGSTWGAPVNLGSSINTTGTEGYPFIADDGTLYFASDSRMGLGGLDIYAASPASNTWAHVVNLGAPINSPRNDFGYITDASGHSGYFVSNRPGGMGGNDIYHFTLSTNAVCDTLLDAATQAPVQDAIVSLTAGDSTHKKSTTSNNGQFCFELESGDSVSVSVTKLGYAAYNGMLSASANSSQIIYLRHVGTIELSISASEPGNSKPQDVTAILLDATTRQLIEQKTADDGDVVFTLEPNREYVIKVNGDSTKNYESFVRPISTLGLKPGQKLYEEAKLEGRGPGTAASAYIPRGHPATSSDYTETNAGSNTIQNVNGTGYAGKSSPATNINASAGNSANTVKSNNPVATNNYATGTETSLPNVYFGVGSCNLDMIAKKSLDKIVASMKSSPTLQVEISSNTDATGDIKANMILSARRALACLNYFTSKGIDKSRFIAVGYGDAKLVNNCTKNTRCTEMEEAMNRRTEFIIIKP